MRSAKLWVFASVLPLLLGFDFASKRAVEATLPIGGRVDVIPGWLSVFRAANPDIAFSIPAPLALVVVFGVCATIGLLVALRGLPADAKLQAAAIATLLAGALGNLVDRIGDGTVTDFIRVDAGAPSLAAWSIAHFGTATWPIFNLADAWIFVGMALWALPLAFTHDEPPRAVSD
jgi:signal peptidase II